MTSYSVTPRCGAARRLTDAVIADSDFCRPAIIVVIFDAWNLVAYADDISTVSLLMHGDFLAITETYMNAALINTNNFQLFFQMSCNGCAGGVAV